MTATMKPELKPGCLAMVCTITKSRCGKSNDGRFVTVLRRPTGADYHGYRVKPGADVWLVEAPGLYLISTALFLTGSADQHLFEAAVLRPISDPDVDISETVSETLNTPLPVEA